MLDEISFLSGLFPTSEILLSFSVPFALVSAGGLWWCGQLKRAFRWRTGYSRKSFHLLIFLTSGLIQSLWGLQVLCYFGAWTSLVVFYALVRGEGDVMYEAMARESDAPRRSRYIVMPWLATFFGGIVGNSLFGEFAIMGYLVVGLADAIAEPVGLLWGKHRYRAPSYGLNEKVSYRSIEGSAAILIITLPIFILGGLFLGVPMGSYLVGVSLLMALLISVVEAGSPHGLDNFTLQLAASGLSFWSFG